MPFHRVRDPERLQALIDAMLLVAGELDLGAVLRTIVDTAVTLADATYGALGVLDRDGTGLAEFITVGFTPDQVAALEHLPEGRGILGLLIKDPRPLRLQDLNDHPSRAGFPPGHPPMRSFLGVPIVVGGEAFGNLYLCDKRDGDSVSAFSEEDEDMVAALGIAAGVAIDKARLYARMRELTLVEERERIARDLHDSVIQRLFTVGLSLQGTQRLGGRGDSGERLQEAIDELDDTIGQIRSTVFAMCRPRRLVGGGVRGEVLEVVDVTTGGSEVDTRVDLDGALEELDPEVVDHLLMSLREVLPRAARGPGVRHLGVEVRAEGDSLFLSLSVDGPGYGTSDGQWGTLEERAKLLGGSFEVTARPQGGTDLLWRVGTRAPGGRLW